MKAPRTPQPIINGFCVPHDFPCCALATSHDDSKVLRRYQEATQIRFFTRLVSLAGWVRTRSQVECLRPRALPGCRMHVASSSRPRLPSRFLACLNVQVSIEFSITIIFTARSRGFRKQRPVLLLAIIHIPSSHSFSRHGMK